MLIPFKIDWARPYLVSEKKKKVEEHLEAASIHHVKAVTLLNEGEYEKAAQNALLAQKYLDLAAKQHEEKN
jgi:hypothetical protein